MGDQMPITIELWAASIFLTAVVSGGLAYTYEYKQYAELQANVKSANTQAKIVLAKAEAKATENLQLQESNNAQLESKDAEINQLLIDKRSSLVSARRLWNSHQASCGNTAVKASNPSKSETNHAEGTWLDSQQLSEGVDRIIQRADTRDSNCHTVITFLNNIPQELIR
jgi:hypothetical protein